MLAYIIIIIVMSKINGKHIMIFTLVSLFCFLYFKTAFLQDISEPKKQCINDLDIVDPSSLNVSGM